MDWIGTRLMLRQCLREPIAEIEIVAQQLDDAVSAHLRGERGIAEGLLRQANDKAVWDWLDSVWGKKTTYNRPRRVLKILQDTGHPERNQDRNPKRVPPSRVLGENECHAACSVPMHVGSI